MRKIYRHNRGKHTTGRQSHWEDLVSPNLCTPLRRSYVQRNTTLSTKKLRGKVVSFMDLETWKGSSETFSPAIIRTLPTDRWSESASCPGTTLRWKNIHNFPQGLYTRRGCTAANIVYEEGPTSHDTSTEVEDQPVGMASWDSSTDSLRATDTEFISSPESQNAQGESDVDDREITQKTSPSPNQFRTPEFRIETSGT